MFGFSLSNRVRGVVVGTSRLPYQKQESFEKDEEGLTLEKDGYTSSASTTLSDSFELS